jgi:hypothetical protein
VRKKCYKLLKRPESCSKGAEKVLQVAEKTRIMFKRRREVLKGITKYCWWAHDLVPKLLDMMDTS